MGEIKRTARAAVIVAAILIPPSLAESTWNVQRAVSLEYPALAAQARIEGSVRVELLLSEEGKVVEAHPGGGQAILAKAACENASKWRFSRKTQGTGGTGALSTVIEYMFTLTKTCDRNYCPTTVTFDFPNKVVVETAPPRWQPGAGTK